ncbi:MAG: alpha/beta hydrolase [Clostridia bacterium]|nr:alpha/beta hydrolase [Clostridia bacterium]
MATYKKKKKGFLGKIIKGFIALALAFAITAFAFSVIPIKTGEFDKSVLESSSTITVNEYGGCTYFIPKNPQAGLIFYQGARVDAEAYAPLMRALAEREILTILIDSPLNFAYFGINVPDGIQAMFPNVKKWYIGGHSMGAEIAGKYLKKHIEDFEGLALFAGFVTKDFSDTDLKVISIYGENDGVLTESLYEKYRSNLPKDYKEFVIPGGNHSGFAYYGPQKGDNEATISKEEQITTTARYFARCVK